jgi:CheY-like chemotaxis protein
MRRIVVVEDNPDNRELVRVLLSGIYDVTEYESGQQALEGIRADKPDLVLLDISLPQMDGPEVVRHIRMDSSLKDLPVIALTAHAMAGDREKFLAAGFTDYLTKPIIDDTLLVNTIERWINDAPAGGTLRP